MMTQTPAPAPARIRFGRPLAGEGFIDAAWWPRSLDLTAELPALLDALPASTQPVTRVSYILGAWDTAPRRMSIGSRVVRLGGYTTGDPTTISLWDSWGSQRIDLLVIAPSTDAASAESIMKVAERPDGTLRAAEILRESERTSAASA